MVNWEKHEKLKEIIKNMGSLAVAFSGGVDSTYLLRTAHDALGDKAIAVTIKSPSFPEREYHEATEFAQRLGIKHITVEAEESDIELFADNPPDRCYICKKAIFKKVMSKAAEAGISNIADGSNVDDLGDYRPGLKALKELGIRSPLVEAGITKQEIREFSQGLGIPAWDKPAYACLATRIPCGEKITMSKLKMVELAEQFLFDLGFKQVRVRHHGDIARIEVESSERFRFFDEQIMDRINDELHSIGFRYVSMDLGGYRMGSMNKKNSTK